jgi:anaerobic magnesium-protoporphyrin IX monomethyl ester cyclase
VNLLLVNPPYQTLTSNLGVGHQAPLGLLMVGGALIDAGHRVKLLDAECGHLTVQQVAEAARAFGADVVMTGHAGSTPAHPVCLRTLRAVKAACPDVVTVYGGVYPSYHAEAILRDESAVDVVVRGEGEAVATDVVNHLTMSVARILPRPGTPGRGQGEGLFAPPGDEPPLSPTLSPAYRGEGGRPAILQLDRLQPLTHVPGVTFRDGGGRIVTNPDRAPIRNLDDHRVGWELIEDWDAYTCFGMGRAAIVQFSRGCPHRCTYCGQHGFWVKWRHRDVTRFVDEVEWLARARGVRFLTLADENPTTRKDVWARLLTELADRRLPVHFFATIRATDIVRDADLMPLYCRAGVLYVLMGIESTRDDVLADVRKGSTTRHDVEACRLLKRHGIYSILGHIVGLGDESWAAFRAARRALRRYDGDYLNAMYVTPHDWTPFGQAAQSRDVVEPDLSKWDYRHQILAEDRLKPWQLFLAVKWLELCFHLRPARLRGIATERDRFRQRQALWCALHTGAVWVGEVVEFGWRQVRGKHRFISEARKTRRPTRRLHVIPQATSESDAVGASTCSPS